MRERKGTFWEPLSRAPVSRYAAAIREEAAAYGIALAPYYLAVALEADSSDGSREMPDLGGNARARDRRLSTAAMPISASSSAGAALFALRSGGPRGRREQREDGREASAQKRRAAQAAPADLGRSGNARSTARPSTPSVAAAEAALAIGTADSMEAAASPSMTSSARIRLLYEGADVERLRAFAARGARAATSLRRKTPDRARTDA